MTTSFRQRFSRTWLQLHRDTLAVLLLALTLAACGGAGGGGGGGGAGDGGGGSGDGDPPPTVTYFLSEYAGNMGGTGNLDGAAYNARFNFPQGVAFDSAGNLYVADSLNRVVRKITATGTVSTFGGRFDAQLRAIAVDAADAVTVTGGTVVIGLDADGQEAWSVPGFDTLTGLAYGGGGTLYLADAMRSVVYALDTGGNVTVFAGQEDTTGSGDGTGTAATFTRPSGLAMNGDGSILYVADAGNHTLRAITVPGGVVTTLAGSADEVGEDDGTGAAARFSVPTGIALGGDGNLIVTDTYNHALRQVTPAGVVTTVAGNKGYIGSADGLEDAARFNYPAYIARDPVTGDFAVSDVENQTIRSANSAWFVSTLAGTPPLTGSEDGCCMDARFQNPAAIAADSAGNLYVLDERPYLPDGVSIRVISQANEVSTLFDNSVVLSGIVPDGEGGAYFTARDLHAVGLIDSEGNPEVVAGAQNASGNVDGDALTEARFYKPGAIVRHGAGDLYLADAGNCLIRKISGGVVSTLAGNLADRCYPTPVDGTGPAAAFGTLRGLTIDADGNLYASDTHAIRKITPDGVVTTLAGEIFSDGSEDGTGDAARFDSPQGLAVDGDGNVYVADTGNHTVRKITPAGVVTTFAGVAGSAGFVSGVLPGVLNAPRGVVLRDGKFYITTAHGVAVIEPGGGGGEGDAAASSAATRR